MILSVTGHRPPDLGGFSSQVHLSLIREAKKAFGLLSPSEVIVGMALGWDQACAEAAILMGIPFRAYIPFAGQEKTWEESSRDKYQFLLSKAKITKYVSHPGYSPWKMHARNEAMVVDSDCLLAMWSGKGSGGTYSCIKYAREKNKPVYNAWPSFNGNFPGLFRIEDIDDIPYVEVD